MDFTPLFNLNIEELPDDPDQLKELLKLALQLIQVLLSELQKYKQMTEGLKDEINRLKGEKGKPNFKASRKDDEEQPLGKPKGDESQKGDWKKSSKRDKAISIHNEITIAIEEENCPKCGRRLYSKGYETIIIQDIIFKLNNTAYHLEEKKCSSPGCKYQIRASLPEEVKGSQFGSNVRNLTPLFYYEYRITQPQLSSLYADLGLDISDGEIDALIQAGGEKCIPIAEGIAKDHLKEGAVINVDETGWRSKGKNKYLWILSNKEFTYYSIEDKRNSSTANKLLLQGSWKEEGEDKVAQIYIITDDFSGYSPNKVKTLGSQLCWTHEIRHYEKLIPFFEEYRKEGEKLINELYTLLDRINNYRLNPTEEEANRIEEEFVEILIQEVKWLALKDRMKLTVNKKERLLLCVKHPEIEPTNNQAERDIRPMVVRRKISGGTRSERGEKGLTSAMSVLATAKKRGKNVLDFFQRLMQDKIASYELSTSLPP